MFEFDIFLMLPVKLMEKMVGMRDRLIHGYYDDNLDMVWETTTKDLPELLTHREKIVGLIV